MHTLGLASVSLRYEGNEMIGAGDEARTRDPQLGKLMLYQLSYSRFRVKDEHGLKLCSGLTVGADMAKIIKGTVGCQPS